MPRKIIGSRIREGPYGHIDAGMVGAPEDIMVNNDKVTGDGVVFVEDVLVDTFYVGYGDR